MRIPLSPRKFAISLLVLGLQVLPAQERTLTVMCYNVLNFNQNSSDRVEYFATIFDSTQADIVVVCEMQTADGMDSLLAQGFSNEYVAGPFWDHWSNENAVYYKDGRVTLDSVITIGTELRDITGYRFIINDHQDPGFRLTVFSAHLKASDSGEYRAQRHRECCRLADFIAQQDSNYYYAFAGDFNFYGASEAGYKLLLDSLAVDLEDPIDARGQWHDDSSYSYLHTQSTRTTNFGGGASGGLDDRFDFILLSHQMLAGEGPLSYITGTYTAFGNDGNHYNGDINNGNNSAVSAVIAEALYQASDHLPVLLELSYPRILAIADRAAPAGYQLLSAFPNPYNSIVTLAFELQRSSFTTLTIHDLTGRELARLVNGSTQPGNYQVVWDSRTTTGKEVPSGIYIARLVTPDHVNSIKACPEFSEG
ncbi:MAG: endonuclease/exonuclease/phosphatase family protein [Candidatus Neomarinimicrobiota bacterium]